MRLKAYVLFLDTNSLMHYVHPSQIDWLAVTNSAEVTLVIPSCVFRELDKLKFDASALHLRQRAKEVVSFLAKAIEAGQINSKVTVEADFTSPTVDDPRLNPTIVDDVLIATVLNYRILHQEANVSVLTADTGLRLKMAAFSINAFCLDEKYERPSVADPASQELQKLRKQLAQLEARLPRLLIVGHEGTNLIQVPFQRQAVRDHAGEREDINKAQEDHSILMVPPERQPIDTSQNVGIWLNLVQDLVQRNSITREDALAYNTALKRFWASLEKYFDECYIYEDCLRRTLRLELYLANRGTAPASGIDVHFHFPDGFEMVERWKEGLVKPRRPSPPSRPLSRQESLEVDLAKPYSLLNYPRYTPFEIPVSLPNSYPSNISSLRIKKSNSYDVEVSVQRLNHHKRVSVCEVYLRFASWSDIRPFTIDVTITAVELPEIITQTINVIPELDAAFIALDQDQESWSPQLDL